MNAPVASCAVTKFDPLPQVVEDLVVVEEPLELRVGFGPADERQQTSLAVTMRTPGNDLELALGFLLSEQIVRGPEEVRSIQPCRGADADAHSGDALRIELAPGVAFDPRRIARHFAIASSCGICGKATLASVRAELDPLPPLSAPIAIEAIRRAPALLRARQPLFHATGGLHAAGLFDARGELLLLREDVGRHNALDKLIGAACANDAHPFEDRFVLVSGRACFELVQKCAAVGASILAAVGAPSSSAIALARELDLALLGFVRPDSLNLYTAPERLRP
ncbi:MAG: formate dehydrogenase accessory sulfurtransferase FdhD [Planctomycetes bacterium]|nr:formate dehydrogenase accessory sulfurtransferase FdhD [Planctomycetota bacterium]